MNLAVDEITGLFRSGEFRELIRRVDIRIEDAGRLDPKVRVLLAHSMARTGDTAAAEALARPDTQSAQPATQSSAFIVLGLADQLKGAITSSTQHFLTALRLAQESRDATEIAWSFAFLLNHYFNYEPEVALAMLPDARRAVTSAGDAQATAYLHNAIAIFAGQKGQFDEARRHCDVMDSMLAISPNLWLRCTSVLNRACIDVLTCRYASAAKRIGVARDAAARAGLARAMCTCDSNLAHVQLLTGHFSKSLRSFRRIFESPGTPTFSVFGALEGMARVYLAIGDLDQCEGVLREFDDRTAIDPQLAAMFHVRWSSITKARLFLRRERPETAASHLCEVEERIASLGDRPLQAAVHFTLAQALSASGRDVEAAVRLLKAARLGVTRSVELRGQYFYAASTVIGGWAPELSKRLSRRAQEIWGEQGVVSLAKEMDFRKPRETQRRHPLRRAGASTNSCASALNSLAASLDLGGSPRLLANELQRVLADIGCEASVTDTGSVDPDEISVDLGTVGQSRIFITCRQPADPLRALLVGDILRVGEAAVALERYRDQERNRAALWPADPIETEAGALFLAEEMQSLLSTARRIAPTDVPVLITGETGTGKEILARLIHAYSNRAKAPFLPFNCSAVPKDMLDSQLFGHRRGSFTGAAEHFAGVIRGAAHGTLFLDEIGETTVDVQPKLLRFLESGEVHPIGELQPARVDVRVIAATNADLDDLVSSGRFRQDLFYRLNIVRLHLPPLRERRVEIPTLANHYLHKHAQEYGKGDLRIAEETMEYLVLYRWPGNVRQLANEMRRMAALAESGALLMPEHLSVEIAASRKTIPVAQRSLEPTEVVVRLDQPMAAAVQHVECALILYALQQTGANMEDTATLLGLSRKGLYLKRHRYGIEVPGEPGTSAVA